MSNINRPNHWHRLTLSVLMASIWLLAAHSSAHSQEAPAAEDSGSSSSGPYAELRKSKDRSTQLLVDRYFSLVRTQEWTDKDGKKVVAKYKSHDPNLQWVKLEVARGRGADRSVKDYQLPLARLSKASQSRVKQIAAVQKRLDEELAKPAEDGAATDAGAPMVDEVGEEPRRTSGREGGTEPEAAATTEAASAPVEQPAPAQPAAPDEPFDPDPLGFGEMDLGPGVVPLESGTSVSPPDAGLSSPPAANPQSESASIQGWTRVRHEVFSVEMPSQPQQTTKDRVVQEVPIHSVKYELDLKTHKYRMVIAELPPGTIEGAGEQELEGTLEGSKQGIIAANNDRLLSSTRLEVQSKPALDFTYESSQPSRSLVGFARLVVIGDTVITLQVEGAPSEISQQSADKFWNTFVISAASGSR